MNSAALEAMRKELREIIAATDVSMARAAALKRSNDRRSVSVPVAVERRTGSDRRDGKAVGE